MMPVYARTHSHAAARALVPMSVFGARLRWTGDNEPMKNQLDRDEQTVIIATALAIFLGALSGRNRRSRGHGRDDRRRLLWAGCRGHPR